MKQFVLILILVATMTQVAAQNDAGIVRPLTFSIPAKTTTSRYLYIETGWGEPWALYTANNNSYTIQDSLHKSSFGIGIHSLVSFLSFQRRKGDSLLDFGVSYVDDVINRNGLALNIGYTYNKYAYEKDRWSNAGFQSHWLTLDALFVLQIVPFLPSVMFGGRCDLFLGASTISHDAWDYNGINPNCYKRITISRVVGFRFSSMNCFLDITMDIGNKFDKDKIMYYNEVYSYGDAGDYIQFRLGYRFFTPARRTL